MLLVALLGIALLTTACEDEAQTVRDANQTPAVPTATAEAPTPSAEIHVTELMAGDCVNSTIPDGISIDSVVIVPCSGDWQYRVLNSFQVPDAEVLPDKSFFHDQVAENCDRRTSFNLFPTAESWEQGHRTVNCLQHAADVVVANLLEAAELNAEDLGDDEASCLEEWVAEADLLALVFTSEDPAPFEDFIAQLERCAPSLLGIAAATPTPAVTPTPAPTPTPQPTPTPEPVADAPLSATEVYARVAPSVVFIETPASRGSGVLIDGGYIVTNRHVVWPYESVWVTFPDGAWYEDVPVVGWDALSDLAVLGPVETAVAPAELADGEGLPPGSELYLIGYPAETEISPEPTISRGILSRFREWEWFGMTYLQTDASVAGGQSGGALVNDRGQVVGISTFSFGGAEFALATSISDDIVIVEELIEIGWDTDEPSFRRLEVGEVAFGFTLEMSSELTNFTFVLDGEAGMTLQLELDGLGDGAFAVARRDALIVEVDAGITGTEFVELELEVDGPHFVIVGMSSEEPQVFELSSNVLLGHLPDLDDDETMQVGEVLTGNVDHPYDSDVFWLQLEEGESVAIFVESVSIDTHVVVGFLGTQESIAFDDDGAGGAFGTDSVLFYRALEAGSYFILVSNAIGPSFGGYLLGVEAIDALVLWDDNGDGEITCDEASANSIAPVSFTHPAYDYMNDSDGDGVICD